MMKEVLVLYYSHTGAVKEMAQLVARGVESVAGEGSTFWVELPSNERLLKQNG